MAKIEHVFVLMMENRSFDHMLAFSGLPGITPPPPQFNFSTPALGQLGQDPPHEFEDVAAQINGGAMTGFLGSGGPNTMLGFNGPQLPVIVELARNNLCFDNWFSSLPGPTWPNRLFAHAASSGGLDNSLSALNSLLAVKMRSRYLDFENGHIFDHLTAKGVTWRIYHHKKPLNLDYPQVLSLKGMVSKWWDLNFFRPYASFASDMASGDVAGYTFIEPAYGIPSFSQGNSQHPTGAIGLGERLIKDTYNAIFNQPVGDNSALLVTWDEHGGFFDHVAPPAAVPPGDEPLNQDRAQNPQKYTFTQFGVRVPAVLISPWLPAGLGSRIFPNASFDHAAIVRALRSTFSLGGALTNRDNAAPDWNSVLLARSRTLTADLTREAEPPALQQAKFKPPSNRAVAARGLPDGTLRGMVQIAADIDWYTAERLRLPPLIASNFQERLAQSHEVLAASREGPPRPTVETTRAHMTLLQYMAAVEKRDRQLRDATPPAAGFRPVTRTARKRKPGAAARKKPAKAKSGTKRKSGAKRRTGKTRRPR